MTVSKSSFSLLEYRRVEMNAVAGWELDTGCFICVLTTETQNVVNQIAPHTREGISGWLTCHNPSFPELSQVRKHVAMFCIEVVGLDHHLHQFTSIAHFYTVSHWNDIYLYFHLVKIQFFDYGTVTTILSCLNWHWNQLIDWLINSLISYVVSWYIIDMIWSDSVLNLRVVGSITSKWF